MVSENRKLTEQVVILIEESMSRAQQALTLSSDSGNVMRDIQQGARQIVDAVGQFRLNL